MFKIIEKSADVTKCIESIANRTKKLDTDIHAAAVSCLWHADKHGDITLMNRLIEACGRGRRRNAMREWAIEFGKFGWDMEAKELVYNKRGETRLEEASALAPWDFKPEAEFKPFNLEDSLINLLRRAMKASNDERNKVSPEMLVELTALVKQYEKDASKPFDIHDLVA